MEIRATGRRVRHPALSVGCGWAWICLFFESASIGLCWKEELIVIYSLIQQAFTYVIFIHIIHAKHYSR